MKNYFISFIAFLLVNSLTAQTADTTFNYAMELINRQNFSKAIPHLEKLEKEQPGKLNIKLQLAFCYRQTGNIDKSIDLYQKIVAERPDYANGYYMLANVYLGEKTYDKALVMSNKSLDLEKNDPTYLLLKAQILREKGDIKEACKYFKKAKKNGSDDAKRNYKKYCK